MSSKKSAKAKTKSEIASEIASSAGLTKVQVNAVLSSLGAVVQAELKAGRPVAVAGLVKITQVHKAATAARPGRNPFTGAEIMIKAKPARRVVKVRALKALKDMV
jgi:nucleoid DNA-binding protein